MRVKSLPLTQCLGVSLSLIDLKQSDNLLLIKLVLPIELPEPQIQDFCRRWQVSELALFGSILRDDFSSSSDVDFLVSFSPEARHGLMALSQMRQELQELVGREVDLVSKQALEHSHNWIRRQNILSTAETIYVKR
jgi:predicted nucleotidyltransferase